MSKPRFNPIDYPICFTQPLRLAPSTWTTHVPFGMFLVQLTHPKLLVELGSYYGVSYCSFCQAIDSLNLKTKCFAVDTWKGDEQSSFFGDAVYNDLKRYHEPLYDSFSTLLRSTFDEAVSNFEDESIDLLHIDGYHTYEAVKHDFETWLPKMSKSGVILFHDIHEYEETFGVWKFWKEIRDQYSSFEFIHGHGLGLIAVSDQYPKSLDLLFKLPEQEILQVQEFFHWLGTNAEMQYKNYQLENQLSSEKQHNAELTAQLNAWEKRWVTLQNTTSWRILQKVQGVRQRLLRPGTWQDSLLQAILALRLLGKNTFIAVPRYWASKLDRSTTENIEVSIVIPVFNLLHLTQACIESIYRETISHQFEIIVVDNASMDATPRWLIAEKIRRSNLKVLSQKENIGFGPAINKGMEHSKGKFIVLLNNDTIVAPGWLDHLLAGMENDSSIGIISPVTNYVGDGLQKDKDAEELTPDLEAISQYASQIANRSEILYEAIRLVFFCVLLRRELIDRIGFLDTSYQTGNFEDDDYCFRARVAGYRLAVAPNSLVYHLGSATFKGNDIPHAQLLAENSQKFYKKVGSFSTSSFQFPARVSENIEVSVIVRTMNRSATLRNALMSLANQTYKDFEVVLINDGGEDMTELLSAFKDYFAIQYVRYEANRGRSAAANAGLDRSRGTWITFLDEDDIAYPWHLESLTQAARRNGSKFIYSDFNRAIFLGEDLREPDILNTPPSWEYNQDDFQVINHIPIHCWLFWRDCIGEAGKIDEGLDMLEDYDFLLRLLEHHPFHHLARITCEYRFYQQNQNSVFTQLNKTLDSLRLIYQRYPAYKPDVAKRRTQMTGRISKQIDEVKEIMEGSQSPQSADEINRRIIQVVLGL